MAEDADPLEEAPYDPLDEEAARPDETLLRAGSCPEEGFALSLSEARGRAARLAAGPRRGRGSTAQSRKRAFLLALAASGNVTLSAARAGWSPSSAREARKEDAGFAAAWDDALEVAADIVDAELLRRAVHGVQEEVWRLDKEGNPVLLNVVTRYSDQLLLALAKGVKPDKYRERQEVRHEATKGGVLLLPAAVPLDEWEAAAAAQQSKYRERRQDDA